MPKRRLDIERPLPMRPVQGEQTPRVARWCENVDATETDRLKGLRGPQTVSAGQLSNVVVNTSNEAWGVDPNDNVETVSGTSVGSLSGTPIEGEGDTHGEAARWPTGGTPQWAGPHDVESGADAHGQFPSSPSVQAATLEKPSGISGVVQTRSEATGQDQITMPAGYTYHFACAWLYDGYQEGPVAPMGLTVKSEGLQSVTVNVLWSYNSTNARVTDLVVYVIENPSGGSSFPDDLPLYYVETIPVDDGAWASTSTGASTSLFADADWSGYYSGSGNAEDFSGESKNVDSTEDQFSGSSDPPIVDAATIPLSGIDALSGQVQAFTVDATVGSVISDVDGSASATATVKAIVEDGNGNSLVSDQISATSGDSISDTLVLDGFSASSADVLRIEVFASSTASATDGTVIGNGTFSVSDVRVSDDSTTASTLAYTIEAGTEQGGQLISGQTYQERAGISRAVAREPVTTYQHAVSAGPYRAVAGPEIDARIGAETTNQAYVLRSKAYRPDMFDWATDFAQVGERVEALAAAERHVLAFCTTDTYVIERSEWRVVDVLNNVSAFGPSAYVNTGRGLVFCDANGVYLWTPQDSYRSLDGPIYEVSLPKPQYNGTVTDATFEQLTYAPDPEMVTLLYSSESAVKGWALYLPASSSFDDRAVPYWTHLDLGLSGSVDSAYMQGGEAYVYVGGDRVQLFSGGRLGWTWTSPPLRPGGYGREGTFYRADVVGTASTLKYREDEDGSFQSASLSSGGTGGHPQQATINSGSAPPWTRVTRLEVEAEGAAGEYLSALSLTHRPQRAAADT